jgi:hypothetical protein
MQAGGTALAAPHLQPAAVPCSGAKSPKESFMSRVIAPVALAITLSLAGCVVAPVPGVYVPPGVVYISPTYPAPGPGYYWDFDVTLGWGWRHPVRGWHRR